LRTTVTRGEGDKRTTRHEAYILHT